MVPRKSAGKLLILSPPFHSSGGVSSYIQALQGNLAGSEKYFFRGNTGSNKIVRVLLMMKEYLQFVAECSSFNGYNTVFVNTSMGKKAVLRDSIFILIASLFRKKIYLFIHGWDATYFSTLGRWNLRILFIPNKIFVLANEFKEMLVSKGYKKEIKVETTVVGNDFIKFFDANNRDKEGNAINILFLARLEPEKGIMMLLEAFKKLSKTYDKIFLHIAGKGSLESEVTKSITGHPNITYHGLVNGKQKLKLFQRCSVYVLPTSHGEGMPISVLEAMAAGQIIITSSAGALSDFFVDGKMGYKMKTVSLAKLEELLELAITSSDRGSVIGRYNFTFARENVTVEKVSMRLQEEMLG